MREEEGEEEEQETSQMGVVRGLGKRDAGAITAAPLAAASVPQSGGGVSGLHTC